MGSWTNQDNAAGAPQYAPGGDKKKANTTTVAAYFGNTTSNGVFAVDIVEAQANKAVTHAGWVKRSIGTGGRAGRVFYETLVAMSSIVTDAADDATLPDLSIFFNRQSRDKTAAANTTIFFAVNAVSRPAGTTLAYVWQANTGAGFAALVNGAVYSNVATANLAIANTSGLNNTTFRVVVTGGVAAPATSSVFKLTVTP